MLLKTLARLSKPCAQISWNSLSWSPNSTLPNKALHLWFAKSTFCVQLNGAGARLGAPGDIVILMTYGDFEEDEVDETFLPRVVWVDENNRILSRD